MKLTQIHLHTVVVPTHPGRVNSAGYGPAVFDEVPKVLIEAHTDNGLVGLGECPRGVSEDRVAAVLSRLKGKDLATVCCQELPVVDLSTNDMFAYEHHSHKHRLTERSFTNYQHLGVHTLLLDLLGKLAGLPVHALMGGKYRDRISVAYWMGRMTPGDSVTVCKAAQDLGYLSVKCKCALEDDNIERAEAVKDACGIDFKMTYDPNQRFYNYGEAAPMLKRLADVGNIGCIEDPFPKANIQQYRLLCQQGLFPVALHLNYGPMLIEAIRTHACDFINIGDLPWDVYRAGAVCWAAGIPTWNGSGIDLGVTEALSLHVCAATKSMTQPSDILSRNIRQHNLVTNPMPVEEGCIKVPTDPGLGVELDRDALDHFTVSQTTLDLSS